MRTDDRIDGTHSLLVDLERCDHPGDRTPLRETLRLLPADPQRQEPAPALGESDGRYRSLFESMEEGFTVMETVSGTDARVDFRFVETNPAFERQSGLRDVPGRTLREIIPDLEPGWIELLAEVVRTGESARHQGRVGALGRWFAVFAWRLGASQDQRVGVLFNDITDQKRAEEAVYENEARFHTLADNIAQLAWMADESGSIFWYNKRWYEYTGTTFEQMKGWGWQAVHHPDQVAWVVEKISHCFRTGQVWEDTFRLRGRDGTYRWFLSRAVPIRDQHGRVTRWFGTNTDVTEQRQADEAVRRAKEEAEQANRAKDQFLAVLSHELRTPLTPVLAMAQMLEADVSLSADHRETVQMMRRNVELEARLIDDLLDLTRISRDKLSLDLTTVDVHEKIAHVVRMCAREIADKRLAVETDLSAARRYVLADPARFQQVIWNLVKNAIKFTPDSGQITVRTADEGDGRILIEVADTGVGIAAEVLPRIFDAFEQGGREVTRQFGGLGLGLAISRALAEMHGGSIVAASEGSGRGATFAVRLPTISRPAGTEMNDRLKGKRDRLAGSTLLVDDHADTRKALSRILASMGCAVSTAGTVAEALGLARQHRFDLLISDIGLPDASGTELMRQLGAMYGLRGVALSGYCMEDDLASSKAAGFEAHLTKPVNLRALEETVRRLIP